MNNMIKAITVIVFFLINNIARGQFGHFASAAYVQVNGGSSFYNNTAPGLGQDIGSLTFQGTDFGVFEQNSGNLKITGSEMKTFKGIADNVCAASLNYTVYPTGVRPASPVYISISLEFYSDCFSPACGSFFGSFDINAGGGCCSERDQKWQNPGFGPAASIDLTALPIGMYTLEVYYSYTGQDGGNGCVTTKFDNNNNNPVNYTAGFTITPSLPVSFGSIHVLKGKSGNNISWNTFSESDTKYFSIERSANAIDFYSIGQIAAAGFSSTTRLYDFLDRLPLNGINYYRIKMVETNGRFQRSVIVSTSNFKNGSHVINNPVKDIIIIEGIEKGSRLLICNSYGANVKEVVSKNNFINIQTNNLANGTYFIKIVSSKGMEVLPVVIAH